MEPQRILVVDDEPRITDLVAMALRYEGFDVATAGTGRAGLKLVEEFRPALVVLDVMLPDMDGFAVTERLAADRVKVPVLFLTARDAVEDKVRGLTLGGDDYVTKPFSIEELVARIRALLRRTDPVAETRSARLRRSGARRGDPRGSSRRHDGRADRDRVPLAALSHAERAAGAVEGADP